MEVESVCESTNLSDDDTETFAEFYYDEDAYRIEGPTCPCCKFEIEIGTPMWTHTACGAQYHDACRSVIQQRHLGCAAKCPSTMKSRWDLAGRAAFR